MRVPLTPGFSPVQSANGNSGILPDSSRRLPSLPNAIARQARCMSDQTGWKPVLLVSKMPYAGEYHRHLALVGGSDHFFIANRAARLNSAGCASFGRGDQP